MASGYDAVAGSFTESRHRLSNQFQIANPRPGPTPPRQPSTPPRPPVPQFGNDPRTTQLQEENRQLSSLADGLIGEIENIRGTQMLEEFVAAERENIGMRDELASAENFIAYLEGQRDERDYRSERQQDLDPRDLFPGPIPPLPEIPIGPVAKFLGLTPQGRPAPDWGRTPGWSGSLGPILRMGEQIARENPELALQAGMAPKAVRERSAELEAQGLTQWQAGRQAISETRDAYPSVNIGDLTRLLPGLPGAALNILDPPGTDRGLDIVPDIGPSLSTLTLAETFTDPTLLLPLTAAERIGLKGVVGTGRFVKRLIDPVRETLRRTPGASVGAGERAAADIAADIPPVAGTDIRQLDTLPESPVRQRPGAGEVQLGREDIVDLSDPRIAVASEQPGWMQEFAAGRPRGAWVRYETESGGSLIGRIGPRGEIIPEGVRGVREQTTFRGPRVGEGSAEALEAGRSVNRGADALVQRIELERNVGRIDSEVADAAITFIRSMPEDVLEGGALSFRNVRSFGPAGGGRTVSGFYNTEDSLANIALGALDNSVDPNRLIIHEVAHHIQRFLGNDAFRALQEQYRRVLADGGDLLLFQDQLATRGLGGGKLTPDLAERLRNTYRFTNFNEWFAEVLSDKALRDFYKEAFPEVSRNAFRRAIDLVNSFAIGVRNILLRSNRPDAAERVYQDLISGTIRRVGPQAADQPRVAGPFNLADEVGGGVTPGGGYVGRRATNPNPSRTADASDLEIGEVIYIDEEPFRVSHIDGHLVDLDRITPEGDLDFIHYPPTIDLFNTTTFGKIIDRTGFMYDGTRPPPPNPFAAADAPSIRDILTPPARPAAPDVTPPVRPVQGGLEGIAGDVARPTAEQPGMAQASFMGDAPRAAGEVVPGQTGFADDIATGGQTTQDAAIAAELAQRGGQVADDVAPVARAGGLDDAFQKQLDDLQDDIEYAESVNDYAEISRLNEELETLMRTGDDPKAQDILRQQNEIARLETEVSAARDTALDIPSSVRRGIFAGWSDDKIIAFARSQERDPFLGNEWWDELDSVAISDFAVHPNSGFGSSAPGRSALGEQLVQARANLRELQGLPPRKRPNQAPLTPGELVTIVRDSLKTPTGRDRVGGSILLRKADGSQRRLTQDEWDRFQAGEAIDDVTPPVSAADEVAEGLPRHSDVVQEHSSPSDFISAVENPREVGPLAPGIHVAGSNVYRVDAAGNAVRDRSIKSGFNFDTGEFTFARRNADPVPANISGEIEGTQVVDVAGKPLRVFHGTRGDFPVDQLRPDPGANFGGDANVVEGIFFSPERGTAFEFGDVLPRSRGPIRTIEAYVNFQNPATFRDAAARDFDVARLKADGFDGFVNIDRDGDIWEVVAFDNSTIYPVQTRIQTGSRAPEEIIPLTSQETPSVRPVPPAAPATPPVRAADEAGAEAARRPIDGTTEQTDVFTGDEAVRVQREATRKLREAEEAAARGDLPPDTDLAEITYQADVAEINAGGRPPVRPPDGPSPPAPPPPGGSATGRVFDRISLEDGGLNIVERLRSGWHSFLRQMVDELHPLDEFVRAAKKGGMQLSMEENPYLWARMLPGTGGKARVMIEEGTFGAKYWKQGPKGAVPNLRGPSLEEILKPVSKPEEWRDFATYVTARRAVDLNRRKILTGIPPEDARQAIRELEAKYPEFRKTAAAVYKYQNELLDYGEEMGLLAPDLVAKLKKTKDYVPFLRVFEELQAGGFMGKKMADVRSPIRRIKGSEREIVNPLESIVKNTYLIVEAADRNQVGRLMANMVARDPALEPLFRKVPQKTALVARTTAKELGISLEGLTEREAEQIFDIFRPSQYTSENVVTVMDKGKKTFYEVDPDLYRGLLSMDTESVGMAIKWLGLPARILRAGATLSPDFMIRNPIRDQLTAYTYSKYGFLPGVDWVRGVAQVLGKTDEYTLWKLSGGERSTLVSMDREYLQKSFQQVVDEHKFTDYKKSPLEYLQILSEFTEKGTRMGEFVRGVRRGASPMDAAFSSREVTLDFAKMGTSARTMNRLIAFFNANIRDWDRMITSFKTNPVKTSFKVFTGITLPSIALYYVNRDNPRYQELPQWQKDLFWVIIPPNGPIVRIPKPFTLGILFGSVPERFLEYLDTKDPEILKGVFGSALEMGTPGYVPTALLPVIETQANHSFFRGTPIVSRGREDFPDEMQYSGSTSESAKLLGGALDFSPAKIDNIISGYTASLGNYAVQILDEVLEGTGITNPAPDPSRTAADYPVLKSFIARDPTGSSSKSVDDFYNAFQKSEGVEKALKEYLQKGEEAKFKKYLADHPEALFFYDNSSNDFFSKQARAYRTIAAQMSGIRKAQRDIWDSRSLSPQEKRDKLDELNALMTTIAQRALMVDEVVEQQEDLDIDFSEFEDRSAESIRAVELTEALAPIKEASLSLIVGYEAVEPGKARTEYREGHPDVDAHLFIIGRVSTLQSSAGISRAKELIIGAGLLNLLEADSTRMESFRKALTDRWVDGSIDLDPSDQEGDTGFDTIRDPSTIPAPPSFDTGPAPSIPPIKLRGSLLPAEGDIPVAQNVNNVDRWEQVSAQLSGSDLRTLNSFWREGGEILPEQETKLRAIHEQFPFGQPNYQTWLKQTLRQIQTNAANVAVQV